MVSAAEIAGTYSVESFGKTTKGYGDVKMTFTAAGEKEVEFHTQIANSMGGGLKLEDGKLKGMLMSTMMMGPKHLMELETFMSMGAEEGLAVAVTSTGLTLEFDGKKLVLKKE